jgi:hypothetical protein
MLPAQWQAKAVELGALRRLRGFRSVETMLRVLLIHLADGCSLRETAVRARAGDLADVSDVALLKRLRGCGPWFQWMAQELAASMQLPVASDALLPGRRVRLVDGSSVCEPGATGSTWRLHYALNLHARLRRGACAGQRGQLTLRHPSRRRDHGRSRFASAAACATG